MSTRLYPNTRGGMNITSMAIRIPALGFIQLQLLLSSARTIHSGDRPGSNVTLVRTFMLMSLLTDFIKEDIQTNQRSSFN